MTRAARVVPLSIGFVLTAWFGTGTGLAAPALLNPPTVCTANVPLSLARYSIGGSAVPAPVSRMAGQVHHFERANMTLGLRTNADGSYELEGRSGDLVFRKTVQSTGEFRLEIEARKDTVTLAVTEQSIRLSRNKKSVALSTASSDEEDLNRARRLLADSRAVVLLRAVATAVQESDEDSPAATAVLSADAVVGLLTGDVGAPRRIARHLARHALSKVRPAGMAIDCYRVWETRVMEAWDDYAGCSMEVPPWGPFGMACAGRWVIQVESYWWQFVSCSAFPF